MLCCTRVVRGVLLAVGRPDGRLCALTKTEATVLLAVKQVTDMLSSHNRAPRLTASVLCEQLEHVAAYHTCFTMHCAYAVRASDLIVYVSVCF